jgi:flagellar hook assembly protein FlgD
MNAVIAALLTFASFTSPAAETPVNTPLAVGMYQLEDQNAVRLFVTNNNDESVTIRIKNENGAVVYTDVVKNYDKFGRKYVLSSLRKGRYTIEISNRSSVVTQQVTL